MGFRLTIIASIVASAVFGGGMAYLGPARSANTMESMASRASDAVRDKMRKMDSRYYERGPDYATCATGYSRIAPGKVNAEITFSCECFDKTAGILGGVDRASLMAALGQPPEDSQTPAPQLTGAARQVLRKCDIELSPGEMLTMRGTR